MKKISLYLICSLRPLDLCFDLLSLQTDKEYFNNFPNWHLFDPRHLLLVPARFFSVDLLSSEERRGKKRTGQLQMLGI